MSEDKSPSVVPSQVPIEEVETPELTAFVDYWESIKDGAFAPSWKKFDMMSLDLKSVPYVVVADVLCDPLNFMIRFWGTGHMARKGAEKTGKLLNDAPDFRGQTAFDEYSFVVNEKKPLASRDMVNLQDFSSMMPFEQILVRLPLSDDGENVHHVISLAVWEKI